MTRRDTAGFAELCFAGSFLITFPAEPGHSLFWTNLTSPRPRCSPRFSERAPFEAQQQEVKCSSWAKAGVVRGAAPLFTRAWLALLISGALQ